MYFPKIRLAFKSIDWRLLLFPERLTQQVSFLDTHPDYIIVDRDTEYIYENGEHLFHFKAIGHTHEQIIQKIYPCALSFQQKSIRYFLEIFKGKSDDETKKDDCV